MTALLLQVLAGLTHAMILFLIASGLSLIFGVTRTINFAHGSLYMLAAYLAAWLAPALPMGGLSVYTAMLIAPLGVALLGSLIEVCFLRRVYRAPELYQLLLTFAMVLVIGDGVKFLWGAENRIGPKPAGLEGSVPILGQLFPTYDLAVLAMGPAVALGLWGLLHRTRWGVLLRAAASDREMVGALGVSQAWLFTGAFLVGSWLAGLAGALQVPRQALTTTMDAAIIVEAFVVVVVGGMGNVFGAFLGAVLLGVLQSLGILWLPREFHLVVVFVLMAAVLAVRPWGLFGTAPAPGAAAGALSPPAGGTGAVPRWAVAAGGALLLVAPMAAPTFVVWMLVEILAFGLFAGSLQLLVGTGGMISFGHAAYFGLGAYGAALLVKYAGWSMPAAFLVGPALAAAAALVFGCVCVRLRGIPFAMLTLACAQIAYAIVHQWYAVTGGDNGLLGIWPAPAVAPAARYYYLALAVGGGGLLVLRRITASPFGLTLRAARDHALRCEAIGVNLRAHQLAAFVVAGCFAGLAGSLFAFLKGSVFPDYLSVSMSVESLVMVLLGGIHRLAGAPVGAAVFKGLDTLVTLYTEYWQAFLGGLLLTVVLAFPDGVMGLLRRRASRGGSHG
ncbi:MAG: Branched-chain amino acid ABC-type transport system [candidate division NC10 bacterium]|nr:Branched-chain amino acid ABC-type transport system [candidate division NC10 bacterium]